MKTSPVLITAAVVLVILIAAVSWLFTQKPAGSSQVVWQIVEATNLALDVRYTYDPTVFTPAPFDSRAEYPFWLDAGEWGLYGKRIRGIGALLTRDPGPMLYDFVGSQNVNVYDETYMLERTDEVYEDAYLNDRLILHCKLAYKKTPETPGWPAYFPESVMLGQEVHLLGWVFFSDKDLFYFYAISPQPVSEEHKLACHHVLESLEFEAVVGQTETEEPVEADDAGGDMTEPDGQATNESDETDPLPAEDAG